MMDYKYGGIDYLSEEAKILLCEYEKAIKQNCPDTRSMSIAFQSRAAEDFCKTLTDNMSVNNTIAFKVRSDSRSTPIIDMFYDMRSESISSEKKGFYIQFINAFSAFFYVYRYKVSLIAVPYHWKVIHDPAAFSLTTLKQRYGHDFSVYKFSSLKALSEAIRDVIAQINDEKKPEGKYAFKIPFRMKAQLSSDRYGFGNSGWNRMDGARYGDSTGDLSIVGFVIHR